ncbi:MAG TPA: DUF397 domain-containing protein [Actinomycetota bacterium]
MTRRCAVDLSRANWRKSSYSGNEGCVEIAFMDGAIAVRDAKRRTGSILVFTLTEWEAFTRGVRDGEFDSPP